MEKKEMNDSTSSRQLLPSLYPGSPTTTNLPRAGNSHHQQYSHLRSFQHNPAATAHFAYQAGSSSHNQPPSSLFRMTHAPAGMGSSSSTVPQDIFFGSGCAGGSSSSVAPSPVPVAMDTNPQLGGGRATFFSSADTGLASAVGLSPLTCTQPPLSWPANQASSESGLRTPLPPTLSLDFGVKKKAVDWSWGTSQLGKNNITSGGSSSNQLPSSPLVADFADGLFTEDDIDKIKAKENLADIVEKDPQKVQSLLRNRSSSERSRQRRIVHLSDLERQVEQLQQNNKSLSAKVHSQQSTYIGLTAQNNEMKMKLYGFQPEMQLKNANFGVKEEAVDCNWGTSQLGKNKITSGGGSSNQLPSAPLVADFGGLFTQNEVNKIKAEKHLTDIVYTDPKRVRIILRNRRSAAVSKEKRKMQVSDLESKVEQLQQENKSLCARLHSQQSKIICLTAEKNELMRELYGLRQKEMQQKNALNKTPNADVHRLKLIAGEIMGSHVSENLYQEWIPQMMQPEHPRKHNRQLAQIQQKQELQELNNFLKR